MKHISIRTLIALSMAAGGGSLGVIAACSSNSSAPSVDTRVRPAVRARLDQAARVRPHPAALVPTRTPAPAAKDANMLVTYDGPPANTDAGKLSCATPDGLTIKFNPILLGLRRHARVPSPGVRRWHPSGCGARGVPRTRRVHFDPYVRGIMITTMKAGDVTVVATSGGKCGSAPLPRPVHDRRVECWQRPIQQQHHR